MQEKIKEDIPSTREAPETDGVQKEHETGINNENYPRIDGSTSTLRIVQALYREFIGDDGPDFPESASKTVPSYRKLIDGEVDMIFVPYASEDVLNGSYTLADAYYAVVRKDLPESHSARAIMEWLGADDGVRAIERLSMISVIK